MGNILWAKYHGGRLSVYYEVIRSGLCFSLSSVSPQLVSVTLANDNADFAVAVFVVVIIAVVDVSSSDEVDDDGDYDDVGGDYVIVAVVVVVVQVFTTVGIACLHRFGSCIDGIFFVFVLGIFVFNFVFSNNQVKAFNSPQLLT